MRDPDFARKFWKSNGLLEVFQQFKRLIQWLEEAFQLSNRMREQYSLNILLREIDHFQENIEVEEI